MNAASPFERFLEDREISLWAIAETAALGNERGFVLAVVACCRGDLDPRATGLRPFWRAIGDKAAEVLEQQVRWYLAQKRRQRVVVLSL